MSSYHPPPDIGFQLTLTEEDRKLLDALAHRMGVSHTETISRALHLLDEVQEHPETRSAGWAGARRSAPKDPHMLKLTRHPRDRSIDMKEPVILCPDCDTRFVYLDWGALQRRSERLSIACYCFHGHRFAIILQAHHKAAIALQIKN